MREKLLDGLQREDLPEELRLVHDAIGMEATKRLLLKLDGMTIYVRRPERMESLVRRYIRTHYRREQDGTSNARVLARALGRSVEYVQQCLRD